MNMNNQAAAAPSQEWCPVCLVNGNHLGSEPTVNASIYWWNSHGEQTQVKGRVGLENFTGTPLFWIVYQGMHILDTNSLGNWVRGTLYLPLEVHEHEEIHHEVLTSRHVCAHGIHLSFAPGNPDGLNTIQLFLPAMNEGRDSQVLLFKEALIYAEHVRGAHS